MTGPYLEADEDGDAELDALLQTARAGLLIKLARAMDLEVGLAAIVSAHGTGLSTARESGIWRTVRCARSQIPETTTDPAARRAKSESCVAVVMVVVESLAAAWQPDVSDQVRDGRDLAHLIGHTADLAVRSDWLPASVWDSPVPRDRGRPGPPAPRGGADRWLPSYGITWAPRLCCCSPTRRAPWPPRRL